MKNTRIWPEPKIVVLGGGSGVSSILPGLKNYTSKITAIITVADDGGSTGRLREDLDIIAPGDIRNCLVALANEDDILKQLFDYRFDKGELKGHSFGNLFLAAMAGVYDDFAKAIYKTGEILSITGKVLPITLEKTSLIAKLENGKIISGESKIEPVVIEDNTKISEIFLSPSEVKIFEDAKKDILEADYIILGPGSLYTSIIPNLLVKDIENLILKSKAKVYYIVNAVSQHGETDGFSVKDHYDALVKHSKGDIIDVLIVNKKEIDKKIIEKYKSENSDVIKLTKNDIDYFRKKNIKIIEKDVVKIVDGVIRHDGLKIGDIIFNC